MHTNEGKEITFQIFLMVLGYSRYKFLEVTFSKEQNILFESMARAFENIGGVPKEIWFDNMKTVVDRARSQYSEVVFNQSFYYFSKDRGFKPIACRPYRPQTKGKVIMQSLKVSLVPLNVKLFTYKKLNHYQI